MLAFLFALLNRLAGYDDPDKPENHIVNRITGDSAFYSGGAAAILYFFGERMRQWTGDSFWDYIINGALIIIGLAAFRAPRWGMYCGACFRPDTIVKAGYKWLDEAVVEVLKEDHGSHVARVLVNGDILFSSPKYANRYGLYTMAVRGMSVIVFWAVLAALLSNLWLLLGALCGFLLGVPYYTFGRKKFGKVKYDIYNVIEPLAGLLVLGLPLEIFYWVFYV